MRDWCSAFALTSPSDAAFSSMMQVESTVESKARHLAGVQNTSCSNFRDAVYELGSTLNDHSAFIVMNSPSGFLRSLVAVC